MLLHGSVEGPTGWASATIWNSRATEVGEHLGSSGLWNSCEIAGSCAILAFWKSKNSPQEQGGRE